MIKGSDLILYIKATTDVDWYPIGCVSSNSFSEGSQTIENTAPGVLNGWTTSRVTNQNFSLSFSGVVQEDSFYYTKLKNYKRNRTLLDWKFEIPSYSQKGQGYITSLDKGAAVDEFVSFSGSIEGFGEPGKNVNTYIGGVSSTINTAQLLANKLLLDSGGSMPVAEVRNFEVVGNDIQCLIEVNYRLNSSAFRYNTQITHYLDNDEKCKQIYVTVFQHCSNLQSIRLNGATQSESYAFAQSGLIDLTDNLNSFATISTHTFYRCGSLITVDLPEALTINGTNGFTDCNNLTSVYMPKCTVFGASVGNNDMFLNVPLATLTVTANVFLETCNGGNMDGDLQYVVDGGGTVNFV